VFDTKPDGGLDAIAQPGQGTALWLHAPGAQDIHDALAAVGYKVTRHNRG
jgi:hypothetical protein